MTQDDIAAPRVVALMATYNAESFILPVLQCLAAQTYSNFHVLISDDASTDRTAEICEAFAARHERFRLIRQRRNLGWIGNSNALLNAAHGEYFYFADHDDRPKPRYVERLVDALERNPQAVLSFSDLIMRFGSADAKSEDIRRYGYLDGVTDRVKRGESVARQEGAPPTLTMMAMHGLFRASAARRIGGLRHHIAGEVSADWPWLFHLALLGEFVRVPEVLFEKTYLPTNLSTLWHETTWQRFGVLTACIAATRRANLPIRQRLRLQRALVYYGLQRHWWRMNRKLCAQR